MQCAPKNSTFPSLYADVIEEFDAIEVPPGYMPMLPVIYTLFLRISRPAN